MRIGVKMTFEIFNEAVPTSEVLLSPVPRCEEPTIVVKAVAGMLAMQ